jgi:hypothetical protein
MAGAREITADVAEARGGGRGGNGLRLLRVFPGGEAAIPEEKAAAFVLLALLLALVLLRRAFRGGLGAGHLHVGGLDAILVGVYLMIWTAVLRTLAGWLSTKIPAGAAGGVAFVTP